MERSFIPYKADRQVESGAVLVLAPHPDDEVFGCGGAIIRHVAAGDPVHVVIITNGDFQGKGDADNPDYSETRQLESVAAAKVLGYEDPVFMGLPDRGLEYGEKLIFQISEEIGKYEPNLIYAPSIFEMHPDHRALGMSALEAVRRSEKPLKLAMYEVGVPLRPNLLLDISDIRKQKQKAMACFKSQLEVQDYMEHIQALNRFRTYTLPKTVTAAEAYMVSSSEELSDDPFGIYSSEFDRQAKSGLKLDPENAPLVTVIIRSIGREAYLREALDSVALQTYPNIEVLIVNAKGKGHPEMGEWCGRFPLRICGTGEPLARSRAANVGLDNARGEYLIFLDDDDLFDPDHIANLAKTLEGNKNCMLAYAGVRVDCDVDGMQNLKEDYNDPFDPIRLLCHNFIPLHAALFSCEILEAGCAFDENLNLCEDWDFWIQISRKTDFIHINNISATYRVTHSGSNIWYDQELARNATAKVFEKWRKCWSEDQWFVIACYAGDLYEKVKKNKLLTDHLAERDMRIAGLEVIMRGRDARIAGLEVIMRGRDARIAGLEAIIRERDMALDKRNVLRQTLDLLEQEITLMKKSNSWRLTAPLRFIRRYFITIPLCVAKQMLSTLLRFAWHGLPLPAMTKIKVKNIVFRRFHTFLGSTRAYQTWRSASATHPVPESVTLDEPKEYIGIKNRGYVPRLNAEPLSNPPVRLIAFYLPQFHPIPENNEWWGEGFTEWSNVRSAKPQFSGHYQPHVPGEFGYYDLRDVAVMRRQAELARLYGVGGFCFYFYWFTGKRLLETPTLNYLDKTDIDFPFCLCWANENWSRRWDGLDSEILIGQEYSEKDDLAFIEYISRYLKDDRYIRIDGKPLLLIYRPSLLPSPKQTAKRWRKWCREKGVGEIYLAYTQSFEAVNPGKYGFDAAIEFPPNNLAPPLITEHVSERLGNFTGKIFDWRVFPERSEAYKKPNYTLFRGVNPSWDNTARRNSNGTILYGSSPLGYQKWLNNAAQDTVKRFANKDERLVFVNAWNEWAEGTHLEPDAHYGYAYLQATRDALDYKHDVSSKPRIVLVAHDAHPHGAQNLILHIAKVLSEDFGFAVHMVVLDGGMLLAEYGRHAKIHKLIGYSHDGKEASKLVKDLFVLGARSAICNTIVTGVFAKTLKDGGFHVVSLIHEMAGVIQQKKLQKYTDSISRYADNIVFPAVNVKSDFEIFSKVNFQCVSILPQGLFRKNKLRTPSEIEYARKALRRSLKIPDDAKIILSIAFADHRKGIDIFVEMGLNIAKKMDRAYFVWVGHFDSSMRQVIMERINNSDFADRFIFPGIDFKSDIYYAGSDIYALTSREDPFPSVVMEALDAGIPVVAFEGVTGCEDLLSRGCGRLVPDLDPAAFAKETMNLLNNEEDLKSMGDLGKEIIKSEFSFRHYLFNLVGLAAIPIKRVSVIVPNYNYARYLSQRLESIARQTYPVYELIVLDDASTDESLEVFHGLENRLKIDTKLIVNEVNSGNPFSQWLKGIEIASGDYIWIAEADDLADSGFLSEVLEPFSDQSVSMSYCQSRQIDSDGEILSGNYMDYVSDISTEKWTKYYVSDGMDEIKSALSVKNTIPNASAVVFRRQTLLGCVQKHIQEIKQLKVAGDWLTYLYVLSEGKIAFSPNVLNSHRRHQSGLTIGNFNLAQLKEILSVQQQAWRIISADSATMGKANAYNQSLYEQFGLASKDAPRLSDHPEFSVIVTGGET